MHFLDHTLLSVSRYKEQKDEDFFKRVHQFIDSSKKYHWHFYHRSLLHTVDYGQYLLYRNFIEESKVPLNQILYDHIREDFNKKVYRLMDWVDTISEERKSTLLNKVDKVFNLVENIKGEYKEYIYYPFILTNNPISSLIPVSNFGIEMFGKGKVEYLKELSNLKVEFDIQDLLTSYTYKPWMNKIDRDSLNKINDIKKNLIYHED